MDSSSSTPAYQTSIAGHGTLIRPDAPAVPVAYWRAARATYGPIEPWELEVRVGVDAHAALNAVMNSGARELRLEGVTDAGLPVTVPQLRWSQHHFSRGMLVGHAHEMATGHNGLPKPPGQQWVMVHVTQTALARDRFGLFSESFTGEIEGNDEPRPPLTFESDLGVFDLAGHYTYERAHVGSRSALVRIPQATLLLKPSGPPSANPRQLADAIAAELAEVLRVITILSRAPVHWSQIEVESHTLGERHDKLTLYATPVRTADHLPDQVLMNVDRMPADALDRMMKTFRNSPYRNVILTSAGHLAAFFTSSFIEERVANAFTALEGLVQGVCLVDGSDTTLPMATFKHVEKTLARSLRLEADTLGLTKDQYRAMRAKLAELLRPPIVPRVIDCVERFDVRWTDLWPKGTNLDDALREAFRIRNRVVHTASIGDVDESANAADRVHALAERLAYRLLAGEPEWQDWFAYYHVYALSGEYPSTVGGRSL